MTPIGIALVIALPSAVVTVGAAGCLWLIRRRHQAYCAGADHVYCLVLERDFVIALGMAMTVYFGVGVGAVYNPTLGATPLDADVTYTIARVTGLLMCANCLGCGAFVARRVLWWLGRHPLQQQTTMGGG